MTQRHLSGPEEEPAQPFFLLLTLGALSLLPIYTRRLIPFLDVTLVPELFRLATGLYSQIPCSSSGESEVPLEKVVDERGELREYEEDRGV